jgi:hypothetical protein
VDTNTDLGTGEHTLPALQYWDTHRLFHGPLYRADVRKDKVIAFNRPGSASQCPLVQGRQELLANGPADNHVRLNGTPARYSVTTSTRHSLLQISFKRHFTSSFKVCGAAAAGTRIWLGIRQLHMVPSGWTHFGRG